MNKFIGKFFLGIFVIGIFFVGSFSFAQECKKDSDCNDGYICKRGACDKDPSQEQLQTSDSTNGNNKIDCTITNQIKGPDGVCYNSMDDYNAAEKMRKDLGFAATNPVICDNETKCLDGYSCENTKCKCKKPYKENGENKCCVGTLLNTNVPFIGQCISFHKDGEEAAGDGTQVTEMTAFPRLMGGLTKMMVTVILLVGFIAILAGGVMIAASGGSDTNAKKGKELIGKVIIAIALLGASGVILRLINPNFFK